MHKLLSVLSLSLFLLACGGDATPLVMSPPDPPVGTIPVMVSVSPAMNSRSAPTKMTITGTNLNAIMPTAVWSFPSAVTPGCTSATYVGVPVSAISYELTIIPGPSAAVGDLCDIRLKQSAPYAADQTLKMAFSTGP